MSEKSTKLVKVDQALVQHPSKSEKATTGLFHFLGLKRDDYSHLSFTPDEAKSIRSHLSHLVTGATAAIPLICGGETHCPFKEQCQPEGSLISTTTRGTVRIEDLQDTDKLWVFHQKQSTIRKKKGWAFKRFSRDYNGPLVKFIDENGQVAYRCTPEHICLLKWNDHAFTDKTCVYLMRRGDQWRIGTTFFLHSYKTQDALGISYRARAEKADAAWILGVYNTKKEALLMEEYFSIKWGITKTLFVATESSKKKWDGLCAWITQNELDEFHNKVKPSLQHVSQCLLSLGLHLCAPIWKKNSDREKGLLTYRLATKQYLKLQAVNLSVFAGLFDFVQEFDENTIAHKTISKVELEQYQGKVYSLEVPRWKTYVTNGYVTHNCPFIKADRIRLKADKNAKRLTPVGLQCLVEVELLNKWTFFYIDEYEIDETSFTEVQMVRELAEIELMLWRLNNNLAKPENAELVQEVNVGIDKEGNPLTRQEMNAFITTKESLQNRKSKLVKLMVGDRQEKYKREAALKLKDAGDPSTTAANLRQQMDMLVRHTQKLNVDLKQIEGNVIDAEVVENKPLTPEDLISGAVETAEED